MGINRTEWKNKLGITLHKVKPAPKIIIVMDGGVIQNVVKKGTRIKVEVRDFDVENCDPSTDPRIKVSSDGDFYFQTTW